MSEKKIRIVLRWLHIIFGLVTLCYIYSPFHQLVLFQMVMKFFVIPLIIMSGVWIWKFNRINKILGVK